MYDHGMTRPTPSEKRVPYKAFLTAALCGLLLGAIPSGGIMGCNGSTVGGNDTGDGGTGGTDDSGTGGGGNDSGTGGGNDDGGLSAYCSGKGPPIVVGDTNSGTARCSGQIAASAFRYGMCLCQGLSASAAITTDAFDSTKPGAQTLGTGGSVGMNQNLNAGLMTVGGTLQITGGANVRELVVNYDTLISDTLSADTRADLRRNAQIGGDVKCNGAAGSLKVAGNLTYPSTRTLTAVSPVIGSTTRAAVTVATPCDCTTPFNIASYVQQRQTSNDNAAIGLNADQLANFSGDQTLNLNCGRFYLNRIGGAGKINLNVSGRTALFIGGDVNLTGTFTVTLGASGELDLFINGGLTSSAPLNFGNKDAPARVRLYMGGSRNINLSAGSVLGGNLYAPESALVTGGSLEVFGAIFVRSFNPSAEVKIHHDIAILNAADDCNPTTGGGGTTPPPVSQCKACQDCGGQACKAGACGGCTSSADCCPLLVCRNQKCVYEAG